MIILARTFPSGIALFFNKCLSKCKYTLFVTVKMLYFPCRLYRSTSTSTSRPKKRITVAPGGSQPLYALLLYVHTYSFRGTTLHRPLERNTKYKIRNTKYKNTKFKVQNTKHKIQDTKHKVQDTKNNIKNTKYKIRSTKYKAQNTKYKIQSTRRKEGRQARPYASIATKGTRLHRRTFFLVLCFTTHRARGHTGNRPWRDEQTGADRKSQELLCTVLQYRSTIVAETCK